jgi:hypothetical protein
MKNCFKCSQTKPFHAFYKHPKMSDGYLGKCRECTKIYARENYIKNIHDPDWVEKELERQRAKSKRKREMQNDESKFAARKTNNKWSRENKHKRKAHGKVSSAIRSGKIVRQPCIVCGEPNSEAHHEDYSRPLFITWLCTKHHNERHIELRKMERMTKSLIS